MGCQSSSPSSTPAAQKSAPRPPPNFGRKEGLDPKDFIFKSRSNELLIKNSLQINGEQFLLEECNECEIYLLDHIGSMYIDYCKDCKIITGPVSGSVFIRNCQNCIIVIACQQLRLRDCTNLSILLCSVTGPIIESSRNIGIGCYSYGYFGIEDHFAAAGQSCWTNPWYDVYDFTPAMVNYHLLPANVSHHTLLKVPESLIAEGQAPNLSDRRFVPLTYGPSYAFPGETISALVCLPPLHKDFLRESFESVIAGCTSTPHSSLEPEEPKIALVRTTLHKFSLANFTTLLGSEKEAKKILSQWKIPSSTSFELLVVQFVVNQLHLVKSVTDLLSTSTHQQFISWTNLEAENKSKMIFEQWKELT